MPLPLSFRQKQVTQILAAIQAGNSGQIIGIGSVGKSNLLRFLQQKDLQQARLGSQAEQTLFVYVDINKLLARDHWGLLELLLHQIVVTLERAGAPADSLQKLAELHGRACHPDGRDLALRYLDRALAIALQGERRMVFLLDEFDLIYPELEGRTFAALRALRDEYKYQLSYWAAVRRPLTTPEHTRLECEPFAELVSDYLIWLGPYERSDAEDMLKSLEKRSQSPLNEQTRRELLALSGGHPGLMRAIFAALSQFTPGLALQAGLLLADPAVEEECARIWHSLPAPDQNNLRHLATAPGLFLGDKLEALRRKGLVGGEWSRPEEIFSSLWSAYISHNRPPAGVRIRLHPKQLLMYVEERPKELTTLERRLLQALIHQRGDPCSIAELSSSVYGDEAQGEGDKDRLEAVVRRLRDKIDDTGSPPRWIVKERGGGYILKDTGEE